MQVTIIPSDHCVIVDGLGLSIDLTGFSALTGVHAVQWQGQQGEIEYNVGKGNVVTDSLAPYESILAAYDKALAALQLPPSLAERQESLRQTANAYRDTNIGAGVVFDNNRFDTTSDSIRNINGAATMAMVAQSQGVPFSIDWTVTDNSQVTLNGEQVLALGVAVGQLVDQHYNRCRQVKNHINTLDENTIDTFVIADYWAEQEDV